MAKYPYGLTFNDVNIVKENGCIVIHRKYKYDDFSIGSIHESNNYGPYKILGIVKEPNKKVKMQIQFLASKSIRLARPDDLRRGEVKDLEIANLLIGKVYQSNSYGKLMIIKLNGLNNQAHLMVSVKFLDTGHIATTSLSNVISGQVKDKIASDNHYLSRIGEVHDTVNYGKFKIIEFKGFDKKGYSIYRIKFLDTGFEMDTLHTHIREGKIKDYLVLTTCGVACLGDSPTNILNNVLNGNNYLYTTLHTRWSLMINRCYNPNDKSYPNYGQIGIRVDKRWHKFIDYCKDVIKMDGFNADDVISRKLYLDKDVLQQDTDRCNMIYSKDTCKWVTPQENSSFRINIKK